MRHLSAIHSVARVAAPLALSLLVAACFGGPLVTPAAPPATAEPASPSAEPGSPSPSPSGEPPTEEPVSPSESASASAEDLPFGELDPGTYEVVVYAYDPANGNTGLDRTTFLIEAAR